MKRIPTDMVPLLLAAFLAPLIGGQVSLEASPFDGYLTGVMGGSELPFGARAIIGTLIGASLFLALVRKRVVQIPAVRIGGLLLALVGLIGLSILVSAFKYESYCAWLYWILFAMAFFAAVATLGRKAGVRAVIWAAVAGGALESLKAILEYASVRATEPSHRVFGDWNNPNGLAGMLCLLVPLAYGLCATSERLESFLSVLAGALMVFAVALTQSKGGLLVLGLATVTFLAAGLSWKGRAKAVAGLIPLVLGLVLVAGVIASNRASANAGSFGERITQAGTTQDQSAGYRELLWKGAVKMIAQRPTGYGIGTYRYESGRPGLTEQTVHTHQTWLQLAVEASPLATLLLLAFAGGWLATFLAGARKWPWNLAGLRAGILGTCVAAATDGMIESNLIFLGIGVTLFIVLGAGLQSSSDGSMPEIAPKGVRWPLAAFACVIPVIAIWHSSVSELYKSLGVAAVAEGDLVGAKADFAAARTVAPGDGEALFWSSRLEATDTRSRVEWMARTVAACPNTRYLRAYARAAQDDKQPILAATVIEAALARDPNNLSTLELKYKLLVEDGNEPAAIKTARRLIQVEETPYFKVRAIPELVPLETDDARVFLAANTSSPSERAQLLRPAVEGYLRYFSATVPVIKRFASASPTGGFLGHDMREVHDVANRARNAAQTLKAAYSQLGDSAGESWVDEAVSKFEVE